MAVIEKMYASIDVLHTIVQENLPDWITVQPQKTNTHEYIPYRLAASDEEYMELYLFKAASTTYSKSKLLFKFCVHSVKNGVDAVNYVDVTGNDDADNNKTGIVRIIKKDKLFAVTTLTTDYAVRTGAAIAFTGNISEGNFYAFHSTYYSTTSASNDSVIYNMYNACTSLRCPYTGFGTETVLMPCCDYARGNFEPISDVFMPIITESSRPDILYSGKKKYYKISPGYNTASFPFYVEE